MVFKNMKKFLDIIFFVVGPVLTVFFLFSFISPRTGILYYPDESKIGIAVGIALICIGFLRIYWRKNTTPNRKVEREEKKENDR